MPFSRTLPPGLIKTLVTESLYTQKLKKDCLTDRVFLAIRKDGLDFYHKGGRLFAYHSNGFHTHIKYASVIPKKGRDYLTESELSSGKYSLISDFEKEYTRIKENCKLYSGVEALGVSFLYNQYSYLSTNDVVVLDIEVSFESQNNSRSQDRIDILLFHKKTQSLQFVEAKHYSNKELWSRKKPKVIEQLERYRTQIRTNKSDILREYEQYINDLNKIFSSTLPKPKHIEDDVILLVFGFDRDQQKGRLKKNIQKNSHYSGLKLYAIGNIKGVVPQNLWNAKKNINQDASQYFTQIPPRLMLYTFLTRV